MELETLFFRKVVLKMDDTERIYKRIERYKELIAKIESGIEEVPEQGKNGQMVALQLLKSELVNLQQTLTV